MLLDLHSVRPTSDQDNTPPCGGTKALETMAIGSEKESMSESLRLRKLSWSCTLHAAALPTDVADRSSVPVEMRSRRLDGDCAAGVAYNGSGTDACCARLRDCVELPPTPGSLWGSEEREAASAAAAAAALGAASGCGAGRGFMRIFLR